MNRRMTRIMASLVCIASIGLCAFRPAAEDTKPAIPSSDSYLIRVDVSHPELKVYIAGHLQHTYRVALGAPNTQTPIGEWRIVDKQENWGGGFGTRWLGLNVPWGTYGIHGTNRPQSIGTYVSNGCIRMNNSDVEHLYEQIPIGTRVVITGNPLAHRRTLEHGDIGADVRLVQQALLEHGYYRGSCDGKFGAGTQLALMWFQLAHHMPMDAVVNDEDYRALGLLR